MLDLAGKSLIVAAVSLAVSAPALAQPAAWQQAVARVISSKQTYPRAAQMRGDEGTAKVKIYVSASGAIEKTELVAPSGSSILDREALSLPTKVRTVPAPPGGATALVVPMTWKLM